MIESDKISSTQPRNALSRVSPVNVTYEHTQLYVLFGCPALAIAWAGPGGHSEGSDDES